MQELYFSTVQVDPGMMHLQGTSFWKYVVPFDKSEELKSKVQSEDDTLKNLIDISPDPKTLLSAVSQVEKDELSTIRKYRYIQKLDQLCNCIRNELDQNAYQKCVIFGIAKDTIEGCRIRLYDYKPVTVYPKSNPTKAQDNIKKFMSVKSPCRVMIASIKAAPLAETLAATNYVFFAEELLDCEQNAKAVAKVMGFNANPVFVRNFCLDSHTDRELATAIRDQTAHRTYDLLSHKDPHETELLDLF